MKNYKMEMMMKHNDVIISIMIIMIIITGYYNLGVATFINFLTVTPFI
jgi:hypothetical protein